MVGRCVETPPYEKEGLNGLCGGGGKTAGMTPSTG